MYKTPKKPIATILALLISFGAAGQTRAPLDIAAEFIIGHCYRAIDDISRVKSYARLMKWKELPPEVKNVGKPVDAVGYEAWHVQHEGQHFFVAVNQGTINGKPAEVCSIIANHRPDDLVPKVLAALKPRKVHTDTSGFQVTELYALQHPTEQTAYLNVTRAADGRAPVSIGFMGMH